MADGWVPHSGRTPRCHAGNRVALRDVWVYPVEPNPPAPRALSPENASTTASAGRRTGTNISCANRSPGCSTMGSVPGGIAVPGADQDRARVVGVDQAHEIAEDEPAPVAHAGAGQDQGRHCRVGHVDAKPAGTRLGAVPEARRAARRGKRADRWRRPSRIDRWAGPKRAGAGPK